MDEERADAETDLRLVGPRRALVRALAFSALVNEGLGYRAFAVRRILVRAVLARG